MNEIGATDIDEDTDGDIDKHGVERSKKDKNSIASEAMCFHLYRDCKSSSYQALKTPSNVTASWGYGESRNVLTMQLNGK